MDPVPGPPPRESTGPGAQQLVEMARTSMGYEVSGTNQLMDGIGRMPASNYFDPARSFGGR